MAAILTARNCEVHTVAISFHASQNRLQRAIDRHDIGEDEKELWARFTDRNH